MKNLLIVGSFLVLGATASFASVAACSDQAATTLPGYTCEIGDKIFSNFTETGITSGIVDFSMSGTQYFVHYDSMAAPETTAFSLGFTVSVDPLVCPTCFIIQMQDQMQTANSTLGAPAIPNTSTATVTHTPGGVVSLNALSALNQTGITGALATTSEGVMFSYTPGANGELSVAHFTISQAVPVTVPEPVTMSLTGFGLLVLGLFRRPRVTP